MTRQTRTSAPRRLKRVRPLLLLALILAQGYVFAAEPTGTSRGRGLGDLLSSPLPGTDAREYQDMADALEEALVGFDGVSSVTAIISRPAGSDEASPSVAVQLALTDDFTPNARWLAAIRAFCEQAVPQLSTDRLTIADTSGEMLYHAGRSELPRPTAPDPPAAGIRDETFRFDPWWLWTAGGIGFALVIGAMTVQFIVRREWGASQTETEAGPLDFLTDVPDERIVKILSSERPELAGAILALLPEKAAQRLARREALADRVSMPRDRPDPAMTAALAKVLRERLTVQ